MTLEVSNPVIVTTANMLGPGKWRITGEKKCLTCNKVKSLADFYKSKEGYPSSKCRECLVVGKNFPRDAWKSGLKGCPRCREVKPLSEYTIYSDLAKTPGKPVGYCKPCSADRSNEFYKKNQIRIDSWSGILRRKYGITVDQYDEILKRQSGVCAVCGTNDPGGRIYKSKKQKCRFAIDHCHETGKVRGLLCMRCNLGIGQLYDSPELLEKAAKYVRNGGSL